ncbi:MAG: branched-chain amino acid ABC transporter permease, partial [Anaerolineaceae bacterium]|nr:branched-chain amino acid ABC transporter permease [Anaerolineaceae bacterium]
MLQNLKNRTSSFLQPLWQQLQVGRAPYIAVIVALLVTSLLVYISPRSVMAFLLFLAASSLVYILPMKPAIKIGLALAVTLIIIPIIGMRNISYLEVIFQISLFSALALGLNIVVGFTGLLNLGYVAFYAVGAYLWAFFGSQQPFLLSSIPGTVPPGTPFFLNPNFFYLFLFLGMAVAAIVGILLGLPVLRVRGDYLAIVTLGFGEVIRVMVNNLDKPVNLTNGPQGISPIQKPPLPAIFLTLWNTLFSGLVGRPVSEGELYNVMFYILALIVIVIVIITVTRLDDSRIGRAWMAIREDELA